MLCTTMYNWEPRIVAIADELRTSAEQISVLAGSVV